MIETELFKSHFIPSARPSKKLMVVLHGKGDSLRAFKQFNQELELHDFNFLLLNAPKKFLDGYSWYGDPPFQKQGVLRIREKMFRLLDELESQGWSLDRTFLLGFSQGCLVSTDIALHYPKRLGGVVGVSGYFQFYPRWRKDVHASAVQTPWLLTHGRKDDVLPIEETKYGVQKLRSLGLDIAWIESEKEHTFEEEEYPLIRKWVRQQLR
ncbi:MAG: alpha/beta hydrolase [Bdellovibrio sp.]